MYCFLKSTHDIIACMETEVKLKTRTAWTLRDVMLTIVFMREIEEMTFEQIGNKLGATKEGVRKAYNRQKAKPRPVEEN